MNIKKYIYYTLCTFFYLYKKELSKNDYLKTLLITIIKSLKKIIKTKKKRKKNYVKIIWTDKKVTT